jgi:prevent-host-death family protein
MDSQEPTDTMRSWMLRTAQARLPELVERSAKEGPQAIRRGRLDAAALVSAEHYRRLTRRRRPGLKSLLLASDPRFMIELPARGKRRRRPPPALA